MPKQHFEAKIGTATLALNFMVMSLFVAIPNITLFYRVLQAQGLTYWVGGLMFTAGALTFFGAIFPYRCARHIGQFLSFVSAWWLLLIFIVHDVTPATPISLVICGCGQFAILLADVFKGVQYRRIALIGMHLGGRQQPAR